MGRHGAAASQGAARELDPHGSTEREVAPVGAPAYEDAGGAWVRAHGEVGRPCPAAAGGAGDPATNECVRREATRGGSAYTPFPDHGATGSSRSISSSTCSRWLGRCQTPSTRSWALALHPRSCPRRKRRRRRRRTRKTRPETRQEETREAQEVLATFEGAMSAYER